MGSQQAKHNHPERGHEPGSGGSDLAGSAARAIALAFTAYRTEFNLITRRARSRFETCDWRGIQADAVERIDLYKKVVGRCVQVVGLVLGEHLREQRLWTAMKAAYLPQVSGRNDSLLAETFFNSITRRIFSTVGVDPQIEFVDADFYPPNPDPQPLYRAYPVNGGDLSAAIHAILSDHPFQALTAISTDPIPGYAHSIEDARLAANAVFDQDRNVHFPAGCQIEVLLPEFFRNRGAYLVGRIVCRNAGSVERPRPFVICLRNIGLGVFVDAVLLDEDEVSIVFSFTRSHFHVDSDRPYELVSFLSSMLPLKRHAELYISIGYHKHGKTELYRDLIRHLAESNDRFQIARGERGMVMTVFTLPSYDLVFKIIKDRIEPPKTTSRREVMERYELVFKHDKAGRLVDAQEFEHFTFERDRFSTELLAELAKVAPQTVTAGSRTVSIRHLYVERRLIPLNLYLQEAGEDAAAAAVLDYGQAIKDLAATNIFPGDILLKNFGVTRHGRVVFYDYDELCHVTDCSFRKFPPPRSLDDEYEAEPFFYVGPQDIFPEEFRTFLGLQEPLRSLFTAHHADLFDADYWRNLQKQHRAAEPVDIVAYPERRKLRRA